MEQLKSEIKYEDEPMDVIEEPDTGYYEEGEINSSDDEKNVNVQMLLNAPSIFAKDHNKEQSKGFVTGLNVFGKDENQKKLDRAKRFSLPVKTDAIVELHREQLPNLYRDLGIDKENERHYRFNTLHMRGTENMSTDDVLEYFVSYAPSHVEWINDVSCNIVWLDDVSAARALINLSKKIKNLDKIHLNADPFEKDLKNDCLSEEGNDYDDDVVDAKEIKVAIPPGIWRIGVPCEKNSFLLLRFATRSDKKHRNAEKNSDYYKKYGNPHYGNIPGLISNSLRSGTKKYNTRGLDFSNSSSIHSKVESVKNNPWEELAYEWGKTDKVEKSKKYRKRSVKEIKTQIPDLRISLTNKKERAQGIAKGLGTSSSSLEKRIWRTKIKVPRMKMYADDEEKKQEKNEKRLESRPLKRHAEKDLRSKISIKKIKPRLKFRSEKRLEDVSSGESSTSNNEDEESNDWALEDYCDLRESLKQNKKKYSRCDFVKYESESEDDDYVDDKLYNSNINQRSPLQIEIENDEYFLNKDL